MERMTTRLQPSREAAETLAIQALAYIAEKPERLNCFLDMTGVAPEQVRVAAREPDFLAGVLEHMLGEENLLLAFAQSAGIDPVDVVRACRALGGKGGDEP